MANDDGTETEVLIEYFFQPAEPDVNMGAGVEITRVWNAKDQAPLAITADQLQQLELDVISEILESKHDY